MIRDIRLQGIRYSPINILGVSIPKRRGQIKDLEGHINQILYKLVWKEKHQMIEMKIDSIETRQIDFIRNLDDKIMKKQKRQEEIDYMNSEEYTVVVEGGNI